MTLQFIKQLLATDTLFRWGILPGRYFFIADYFEVLSYDLPTYAPLPWPPLALLINQEEMLVVGDRVAIETSGLTLFQEHILKAGDSNQWFANCECSFAKLEEFFAQPAFDQLASLPQSELMRFGEQFYDTIRDFWLPTMVIELANYGGWALLQEQYGCNIGLLSEQLHFQRPLFYQVEEQELLSTENISSHRQKYFWLANNYAQTKQLVDEDFCWRKKQLGERRNVGQQTPGRSIDDKLSLLAECIWWQQERKKYILMLQHYKELFLKAAQRYLPYQKDLYCYSLKEILALLAGQELAIRSEAIGSVAAPDSYHLLSITEVQCAWRLLVMARRTSMPPKVNVLVPNGAHLITGIVCFAEQMHSFPSNAIAVCKMLTIELLNLIGFVQAIVVENYTSISHTVLMSYACKYANYKVKPALLVIPNITEHVSLYQMITLDLDTNSLQLARSWQGQVASLSPSKVLQGEVMKLGDPVKTGGILVASSLSVENILQYRSAKAFLSEQGGLMSHISILCRELGIPYIVSLPDITQLTSGDMVQLDFTTAIVTKLS